MAPRRPFPSRSCDGEPSSMSTGTMCRKVSRAVGTHPASPVLGREPEQGF